MEGIKGEGEPCAARRLGHAANPMGEGVWDRVHVVGVAVATVSTTGVRLGEGVTRAPTTRRSWEVGRRRLRQRRGEVVWETQVRS